MPHKNNSRKEEGGLGAHMQGREESAGTSNRNTTPRTAPRRVASSEGHVEERGPEAYGYLIKVYG